MSVQESIIPECFFQTPSSSVLASDTTSDCSSESISSVVICDPPPSFIQCVEKSTPSIMSPTTRLDTKKKAESEFIRTRSRSKMLESRGDAQEVLAGHSSAKEVSAKPPPNDSPPPAPRRQRHMSLRQEIQQELNDDLFDGVDLDGLESLEQPAGQHSSPEACTEKPASVLQGGKVLFLIRTTFLMPAERTIFLFARVLMPVA